MKTSSELRYEAARQKVEEIKSFYVHAMVYGIVISLLFYLNYRTTSYLWVVFPLVGWGAGLIGHGLGAFGYVPFLSKSWEERKIKEFLNRDDI